MSVLRQVVVYSRKGCHLCEIVKETLVKLQRRGGFSWSEIDVDSDDELRRKFLLLTGGLNDAASAQRFERLEAAEKQPRFSVA